MCTLSFSQKICAEIKLRYNANGGPSKSGYARCNKCSFIRVISNTAKMCRAVAFLERRKKISPRNAFKTLTNILHLSDKVAAWQASIKIIHPFWFKITANILIDSLIFQKTQWIYFCFDMFEFILSIIWLLSFTNYNVLTYDSWAMSVL